MVKRILVVDDDSQSRRARVKFLQLHGYRVGGADGYQSAIEAAQNEPFDLLLSGIELWDGDGCDLLQDLKRSQSLEGIAVSGFGTADDVQRSLDAGFKLHLVNPLVFTDILESIDHVLRAARNNDRAVSDCLPMLPREIACGRPDVAYAT